ncbi:MAG: phosphotransferase family protein [Pseudomonadota bacterium]
MTSLRSASFSGTEAPPPHLQLDLDRLRGFLSQHLGQTLGALSAVKFKGGQSNPTYLITSVQGQWVLRRKPPGQLLASAHAIDREFRVMRAIWGTGVPVAQPLLYCEDASVIGSDFYVAQYVQGRIFWDAELPGMTPAHRTRLYDRMNEVLVRLHQSDVAALGLSDFGRVGGYCARNLARWAKTYEQSRLADIPDMDWLMDHLPKAVPAQESVALLHGDFGLYNLIVHPSEPEISAVLDWEMATLGDPLVDLAHHLRAWWEIPDPQGSATSLADKDLAALGIPTMQAYLARYFERLGQAAPDMTFYLAYAQFRYAAMIQGILKRVEQGTAASGRRVHRQERVVQIAQMARRTLEGQARL